MTPSPEQSRFRHGCIVMASGMGTRFGGNKLMAELAGKPLIGHVLDAVESKFDQSVVVTRHKDVARYCEGRSVRVVLHEQPQRNDTVRLGMDVLTDCDFVTFFQGDQPLIKPESITALLHAAEANPQCIWRVCHEGTPGAPMLFPAWAFSELLNLPEGKGGGFLAKNYPERVRTVPVQGEFELFDVDTQKDLQFLQKHINS